MLQFEIVLLSLPFGVKASVLKNTTPPFVPSAIVTEPWRLLFVITLFVAPPIKRIVHVPDVADTVVFDIVSELPPVFKPSMVTLSAPLRSIRGLPATIAPVIVLPAPPEGLIIIEV